MACRVPLELYVILTGSLFSSHLLAWDTLCRQLIYRQTLLRESLLTLNLSTKSYRSFDLYDEYVTKGTVFPNKFNSKNQNYYDQLPLWCREKIDRFVSVYFDFSI